MPSTVVSVPMLPIGGGVITGNLGVQGTTSLTGSLTALGHSEINTLQVNGQADFIDGVSIDGDPAATEPYVDSEIAAVKNLGFFSGSFNTHADLPANTSAIAHLTPNDFVTVRADETHAGATTRYIASAIAADGTITWTYDMTYSTDVSGKMDTVPSATAGHVAIFDAAGQVEDAGSDLQAATLQFRPMTPNIRNWIPIGVEGVFVGEGTAIVNAPTTGTWRYLAFAKASGALNLIAFEDAGGPMKPTSTGKRHQRIARTKRNGGVTLPTDGWSSAGNAPGLSMGWGEYQQPLESHQAQWQNANLMKIGGRNLLAMAPGGNINFGPRYSGATQFRSPYNMSIDHQRLIMTGAGAAVSSSRLHLMDQIWRLNERNAPGWFEEYKQVSNEYEGFNVDFHNTSGYRGRRSYRLRRFTRAGTGRWPFRVGIRCYTPGQNFNDPRNRYLTFVLDCRTLGTGARWVRADGSANATDATIAEGLAFSQGTNYPGVLRCFVSPTATDTSPAGKVYVVEMEWSAYANLVWAKIYTMTAQQYWFAPQGGT